MNPIRGAIFDLDGTLVDSLPATIGAFNAVVAPFLGTRLTAKEVRGVAGPNYRKILTNFLPPDRVDAGLVTLHNEFMKNVESVALFPGVFDLLSDLRRRGCRLALATLRDAESCERILSTTGLHEYFERTVAGGDAMGNGSGHAVDPAVLQWLSGEMQVAVEETAYVCDSAVDVEAGRKAGLRTAAVTWGYQRKEDLAVAAPDFLFEPLLATL